MFKNLIGGKIFCGLDVGSLKLKASAVRIRNIKSVELLGVQEISTKGFKGSSVGDVTELTVSIQQTLSALSHQVGIKFKDIQLGIGGEWIEPRLSRAVIPLLEKGDKVVSPTDVKRVNHQARLLGTKIDEEVLHDFTQSYSLDDQTIHSNPVGLYARTMAVDMLLLIVNTIRLDPLTKAIQQAGLEVSHIFLASYAAAESSVDDQTKTDGCALIDIGANSTNVLIFKDGFLRSLVNIPLGGDHATRRIAHDLHLSFDQAEEIKKSYGMALTENEKHAADSGLEVEPAAGSGVLPALEAITDESVLVKKETGYFSIKKEAICRSLEPEITKLIDALEQSLKGPFYGSTRFARSPLVKESNHPERATNDSEERVEGLPQSGIKYHGHARGWIPIPEGSIEDRKSINQGPRACPWGSSSQLKAGIMMVGGGSLLAGLLERIEKRIHLPVHLGKIHYAGMPLNKAAVFSPSIGLARLGFTKTWGYHFAASPQLSWRQGLTHRIRELYQEYF